MASVHAAPSRPRRTRDLAIVVATVVAVLLSLAGLARLSPSEVPTVEQVLPAAQLAELRELRRAYGDAGDFAVVLLRFRDAAEAHERLRRAEHEIAGVDGVARTWSSLSRPHLSFSEGKLRLDAGRFPGTELDRFLQPDATTFIVLAALSEPASTLTGARRFVASLDRVLGAERATGTLAYATGSPALRVATWDAAHRDATRMLPVLLVVSLLVPWLFFRSLVASLFPLVLGSLASGITFLLHRLIVGSMSPWLLVLLPIVWSVATMDAMHLYERVRTHAVGSSVAEALRGSRRELVLPCLLTAATTAVSLAVIAAPGGPALLRSVGLWGAVGTLTAYGLTFTLGGPILRLSRERARLPTWPARVARRLAVLSMRRRRGVILAWATLVVVAGALLTTLRVESRYPNVFARGRAAAASRDLSTISDTAGSDLVPLEIYVEGRTERARTPAQLVMATLGLHQYLHSLPETRLVLSAGTLVDEWMRRDPAASGVLMKSSMTESGLSPAKDALSDPRVAPWLSESHGSARLLVLFAPTSFERRSELFTWIEHYAATVLTQHRLRLGGPARLYHAAEQEGVRGVAQGVCLEVALLVLTFGLVFRRARLTLAALAANVAPVVVLLGAMAAFDVPWSLGLLGLPVIVLGLAIDDTIHLMWSAPRAPARGLLRALGRHAGAVLSTSLLLAASLGSLSLSGFQVNHELGMLLPLGLAIATAAELTLLPALLSLRMRRAR